MKNLTPEQLLKLSEITDDEVVPIWSIKDDDGERDKYPTWLTTLDKAIDGGFVDGNLVIISGISGEGKTSLMETLTYNYINQLIPCLWFSYEIPIKDLKKRLERMNIIENYVAYSPKKNTSGKIEWLKHKIKESWVKHATKIVFIDMIDYLSPMTAKDKDNETLILKKIAMELKELAIELEIVIMVSAHITKLREGQEAGMQDIAWSSGIYQMADFVIMIQRERTDARKKILGEQQDDLCTKNTIIKIVKNRLTGTLKKIKCQYENYKFLEITNIYEEVNQDPK